MKKKTKTRTNFKLSLFTKIPTAILLRSLYYINKTEKEINVIIFFLLVFLSLCTTFVENFKYTKLLDLYLRTKK